MHVKRFIWELLLFLCSPCKMQVTFLIIVKYPSTVKTYVTRRSKGVKQTIPAIPILYLYDAWISHNLQKCTGVDG